VSEFSLSNSAMRRIHLFEFTDLTWYPTTFRRIQTDYLQFAATRGAGHHNLVPLFRKALQHAGTSEILDLCSGGMGPWPRLRQQLKQAGLELNVTLSDKFPTSQVFQARSTSTHDGISYLAESVDALDVPVHLKGMRTMFEGFHHFEPENARLVLQDVQQKRVAIGIFEASLKPPLAPFIFLLSPLMTLLGYLFATPFIRPFSWSRLLWTYLVPIVPLSTCWDGLVSFLRTYSQKELRELVQPLQQGDYHWEIGEASTDTPLFVFTYLLGYPL